MQIDIRTMIKNTNQKLETHTNVTRNLENQESKKHEAPPCNTGVRRTLRQTDKVVEGSKTQKLTQKPSFKKKTNLKLSLKVNPKINTYFSVSTKEGARGARDLVDSSKI